VNFIDEFEKQPVGVVLTEFQLFQVGLECRVVFWCLPNSNFFRLAWNAELSFGAYRIPFSSLRSSKKMTSKRMF
jgi:hypothetical protein